MTNPDPDQVRVTFDGIARRYDLANRLLSLGLDLGWRRLVAREAKAMNSKEALDLATGSGDVALLLHKSLPGDANIVGLDFSPPMLAEAEKKRDSLGYDSSKLKFMEGDCLDLPFEDESFDLVTIAFGLRNLSDRPRGLSEMLRVLRRNGRLMVLEFSQPYLFFRPFYYPYLRVFLPFLASRITNDRDAYNYLGSSISGFPDRFGLAEEIRQAGFGQVRFTCLTFAVVALHVASVE